MKHVFSALFKQRVHVGAEELIAQNIVARGFHAAATTNMKAPESCSRKSSDVLNWASGNCSVSVLRVSKNAAKPTESD